MTNTLFVYGTLRPEAGGWLGCAERKRLSEAGIWLGCASLHGLLYDLGGYPGLVVSAVEHAAVSGAIIALHNPQDVFAWLDHYEGIDLQHPQISEYKRVIRDVYQDADGHSLAAWVYVYIQTPDPTKCIASGDWLEYIATSFTE